MNQTPVTRTNVVAQRLYEGPRSVGDISVGRDRIILHVRIVDAIAVLDAVPPQLLSLRQGEHAAQSAGIDHEVCRRRDVGERPAATEGSHVPAEPQRLLNDTHDALDGRGFGDLMRLNLYVGRPI